MDDVYMTSLTFVLLTWTVNGLGIPKDYCAGDTFAPSCTDGSIIMMKSAIYGLMQIGSCLSEDFGHTGCQSNQLSFMDSRCSGLPDCQVDVSSRDLKDSTDCPKDFATYLEAAYTCQKVYQPPTTHCSEMLTLTVNGPPVYIASSVALETSCGLTEAPILLQAKPGQRINITLIDFGWNSRSFLLGNCPNTYGHIVEQEQTDITTICGGSSRIQHVYISTVNQVQITILPTAAQDYRFLIKYEVVGCPDLVPPRNAWLKKDNDVVTLGCHGNSQTWEMKCVSKHWIGDMMRNCSQVVPVKTSETEKTGFNSDHVISVAIGSLALVICCITVTIGVYCIKRHQYRASYNGSGNYMIPVPYKGPPNTIYTKYRPANPPEGAEGGAVSDLADFNNSVATGYSFQRPSGMQTLTAVQVHQPPLQAVQVHQRPLPSTHMRQPSTGSEARRILATQAAVNSSRSRTMCHNPSNPVNPAQNVTAGKSTRTLPPPLPQRPSQNSSQSGALLQLNSNNNTNTGPAPVNSGVLPSSRNTTLPSLPPPLHESETTTLLSNNRPRGVHSPDEEQEDDESVKYYVLEGPSPIYRTLEGPIYRTLEGPTPIKPTLNSDPENSD